jgi:hypothetical protein
MTIARYNCKMCASPFYHAHDGERIKYKGSEFRVRIDHDGGIGQPWKEYDSLGPVAEHSYSAYHGESKLPAGHVWIDGPPTSRHYGYAYDKRAALAAVRAWGKDSAQRAEVIVDAEIERFRGWLRDDWHYVSVGLELDDETEWLGGIEDDCHEYLAECLEDHADTLLDQAKAEAQRADVQRCFI